jgi:hypothetical protein
MRRNWLLTTTKCTEHIKVRIATSCHEFSLEQNNLHEVFTLMAILILTQNYSAVAGSAAYLISIHFYEA